MVSKHNFETKCSVGRSIVVCRTALAGLIVNVHTTVHTDVYVSIYKATHLVFSAFILDIYIQISRFTKNSVVASPIAMH